MAMVLNRLLEQYDLGVLNRRSLLKGLALLAGAGGSSFVAEAEMAAAETPAATRAIAPVRSLNHTHQAVSDMEKSVKFYEEVLGATPREVGNGITTMTLPGATKQVGCWISLTTAKGAPGAGNVGEHWEGQAGTYNHVGYGVDNFNPVRIVAELKERWPGIRTGDPTRTDQLYIYDPDGLPIQLMIVPHDGYIASHKGPDGKDVPNYKPGEHLVP